MTATSALQQAMAHHQAGHLDGAVLCYRQFLETDPARFDVRINLGVALLSQDYIEEALREFRHALLIKPDSPEAHNNLGNALERIGKPQQAVSAYRQAIALRPDYADAQYNLGTVLMQAGQFAEAAEQYRRAAEIDPGHADAIFNLGNILLHTGDPEQAVEQYRKALAINPAFVRAEYNLGTALCRSGATEAGFATWTRCADLIHGAAPLPRGAGTSADILAHDREQQLYLADDASPGSRARLEGGGRVEGSALNSLDGADIAARWDAADARFVVIDNALSDEALANLRQFCWRSAIWQTAHPDGYLIATPEDGMACPLMAQVVTQLRALLPTILRDHPLHYVAGFKYGSGRKGSNVHADDAAVNINLWITPDEANLNPETGGLVVWDVTAPGPDLARYNGDTPATRAYLAQQGAHPTVIAHRSNRMVVFDSDLFHETDDFVFGEGYLDRRINITMLFGKRVA